MKKLFIFLLTAVMLCMSMTAMAAKKEYNPYVKYVVEDDDYQETLATINSVKMSRMPKVAVMYVNNSQADYYKADGVVDGGARVVEHVGDVCHGVEPGGNGKEHGAFCEGDGCFEQAVGEASCEVYGGHGEV